MNNRNNESDASQNPYEPPETEAEAHKMPPLLTALILKAGRESHISNAQRSVHERAARYLGIPVVLVQALAQSITLPDLFWPGEGNLALRVEAGI